MPLKLYKRGEIWWFRGRIEELPGSQYYRQSTEKTTEAGAQAVVDHFKATALRRLYGTEESTLTFADAIQYYDASPATAKDLLKVMPHLQEMSVVKITPKLVKDLGRKIYPLGSTDSWHRHIVTPVRAVINNAHELGLCPPIKIKAYSKMERLR